LPLRNLLRAALCAALLAPFATCTDFTGPSGRGARVPIVPVFSPAANAAKAVYTAAGIEFDRVRIVIIRGEAEVLKDTTVAFSPSSADLTLPLVISATPGEIVKATLEYRAADIVLYSGTQQVTTVATGAAPTTEPTPLILVAVGPGAAAASVEVSPSSGSFPTSAPVPLTATAFTSDHTAIANALFAWTVDDATVATVSAQGIVQPTAKGGVATIRATTLSGKFAEATITFVNGPTGLAFKVQPSNGVAGTAIAPPIEVKIVDANQNPVTSAVNTVSLALDNPPAGVTLSGGGPVAAVNGVATFNDVRISGAATNLKLQATSTGLTSALSATFTVGTGSTARTWTGAVSTDWNVAGNWTPSGVPSAGDSVTIAPATNQPMILTPTSAKVIAILSGASLVINVADNSVDVTKIYNAGNLRLTNAFVIDFTGGTHSPIENRGTVLVDGSAIVGGFANIGTSSILKVISSSGTGADLTSLGTITNEGTIELNDTDGEYTYLQGLDSLVNKAGAVINANQGLGGDRSIYAALRNYGSLNVSASYFDLGTEAGFNSVNTGSMNFTGTGAPYFYQYFTDTQQTFTNTGTIAMGTTQWETDYGNVILRSGTVTGTGVFSAYSSKLDIDFSKFSLPMYIDSETRFPGDSLDVPVGQTVNLTGGYLTQRATVRGTLRTMNALYGQTEFYGGATVYSGGKFEANEYAQVDGPFAILTGGKLTVNAAGKSVKFTVSTSFTNSGQIELTSSGGTFNSTIAVSSGTLTNASGATLGAYGGAGGQRRIEAQLDNKTGGTVYVEQDSYLALYKGAASHVNAGVIDLPNAPVPGAAPGPNNTLSFSIETAESGSGLTNTGTIKVGAFRTLYLAYSNSITNSGVIGGSGTIDATSSLTTFTNNGALAPGGVGAVGTLLFKGNFDVGSGSVEIDVADLFKGIADLLQVTGTATVSGKINVSTLPGFVSGSGASLLVITGQTCVGTPVVSPSGFPNGWFGDNSACFHIFPNLGSPQLLPRD
jgi:hypothetical protein